MNKVNYTSIKDDDSIGVSRVAPLPVSIGSISQFGEGRVAQRTSLFDLNSSYGVSLLRDVPVVAGTATIAGATTGEILLKTGATAASSATLLSASRIRYVPGFSCEVGVAIRIPVLPTGEQVATWGARDPVEDEGFYFGADASGVYAEVLRNGVKTTARQVEWNIDRMDGTGPSGLDLVLSDGNIFQTQYTWYGYGQILFGVVATVENVQTFFPCHSVKIKGTTSVQSPNLPISVQTTNGATASNFDVYLGGRQACIIGRYDPKWRAVGQERGAVNTSTAPVPLVSFRNKAGFEAITVQIASYYASVTTEDHVLEFYINPTLTGAVWASPTNTTDSETALETDVSATALSDGIMVYPAYAGAGQANKSSEDDKQLNFDVPENQIVTMAARTVTGTGTCKAFLVMKEEW